MLVKHILLVEIPDDLPKFTQQLYLDTIHSEVMKIREKLKGVLKLKLSNRVNLTHLVEEQT